MNANLTDDEKRAAHRRQAAEHQAQVAERRAAQQAKGKAEPPEESEIQRGWRESLAKASGIDPESKESPVSPAAGTAGE